MLTPNDIAHLEIMGSDMLREYRDAIVKILAQRNALQARDLRDIVRDNVHVQLEHRAGRDDHVVLKTFVLHPGELARADGVMINHDGTRDHLWVEARWL